MFDAQAEVICGSGDRRVRALFPRAVRIARYARFIEAVATELVEQGFCQFALCRHCRSEFHHPCLSSMSQRQLAIQRRIARGGLVPAYVGLHGVALQPSPHVGLSPD